MKRQTLSSLRNPVVKDTVKLRQRSHRDTQQQTLIEGYREVRASLDNHHPPTTLFVCQPCFQEPEAADLVVACAKAGATILDCTPPVFEKLSYRDRPDGILAVAPQVSHNLSDLNPAEPGLIIIAESVEKPGNLGSILRSADAAGANAVIVCDRRTDINNPNVIRASVGTLFTLPVVEADASDTLEWLRRNRYQTIAATPQAADLYTDVDLKGNTAFVVGTEKKGLSAAWLNAADQKVKIPMAGQADSLNVSAAATLLLFEAVRQRHQGMG